MNEEQTRRSSAGQPGERSTQPSLLAKKVDPQVATIPLDNTPLAAHAPLGSSRIGKFRLDKLIGRGGMGNVFLAYDEQLRRKVAIKFPRVDTFHQPQLANQFLREARLAAQLNHPNLVKIYEVAVRDDVCYIASEWCDGGDLANWLAAHPGPCDPTWSASVVLHIAQAVAHCHAQNIVHLDIKPGNIILARRSASESSNSNPTTVSHEYAIRATPTTQDDCTEQASKHTSNAPESFATAAEYLVPMLTDFGVARVIEEGLTKTRSSVLMGTPLYMAPEQAECHRERIGPASDIFALGIVLHELLYGVHPFRSESPLQSMDQIRSAETLVIAQTDFIPRDLRTICERCMQYAIEDRYASADDLVSDLSRFLRGDPIQARPVSKLQRIQRWCLRPQRISEAITTVFVSQVVLGLWTLLGIIGAGEIASGDALTSSRIQLLTTIVFISVPVVGFAKIAALGKTWGLTAALALVFCGQTAVPALALLGAIDIMGAVYGPYPFFRTVNLGLVLIVGAIQTWMLAIAICASRKQLLRWRTNG